MQCLDIVLRFSMTMRPDVASFARGIFLSDPRHCNPIGSGAEVSASLLQHCVYSVLESLCHILLQAFCQKRV